jgi:hypothetical protein
MAVSSTTTKVIATGNGSATSFSFSPMVLLDRSHLQVTKTDSDGNETVLTWGTGMGHYTISPDTFPNTGSVIYPTNHATDSTRLQAGETLTMKRVVPLLQSTVLENQGGYFPKTQERTFDYARMVDLQQQEEIDRSFKAPVSDAATDLVLPTKLVRAGKLLGFNAQGEPIATDQGVSEAVVSAYAANLLDDATAEEARSTLGAGVALSELLGSPFTLPTDAGSLLISGIRPDATRITILFNGMSATGSDNFALRIGPAAGHETTGYDGAVSLFGASSVATANYSIYFTLTASTANTDSHWGQAVLTLLNRSTNTWVLNSSLSRTGNELMVSTGIKSLAGTLALVRILTTSTGDFSGGTVGLIVE